MHVEIILCTFWEIQNQVICKISLIDGHLTKLFTYTITGVNSVGLIR